MPLLMSLSLKPFLSYFGINNLPFYVLFLQLQHIAHHKAIMHTRSRHHRHSPHPPTHICVCAFALWCLLSKINVCTYCQSTAIIQVVPHCGTPHTLEPTQIIGWEIISHADVSDTYRENTHASAMLLFMMCSWFRCKIHNFWCICFFNLCTVCASNVIVYWGCFKK